jgi:branched-chain amino acid transport system ATP-binding protein
MSALIEARGVRAGYGDATMLWDVDIEVAPGEVVALLGPNGAGKTTTLLALTGALRPTAGAVHWKGKATRAPLHRLARDGLAYVSEERSVFSSLTVAQNLRLGRDIDLTKAFALFPVLADIPGRRGGLLSGGEQQMLTLCRTLMGDPDLVMIDEPTEGLAPKIVELVAELFNEIKNRGVSILLVEQKLAIAMRISQRVYVMGHGAIVFEGTPEALRANETVRKEWLEV